MKQSDIRVYKLLMLLWVRDMFYHQAIFFFGIFNGEKMFRLRAKLQVANDGTLSIIEFFLIYHSSLINCRAKKHFSLSRNPCYCRIQLSVVVVNTMLYSNTKQINLPNIIFYTTTSMVLLVLQLRVYRIRKQPLGQKKSKEFIFDVTFGFQKY